MVPWERLHWRGLLSKWNNKPALCGKNHMAHQRSAPPPALPRSLSLPFSLPSPHTHTNHKNNQSAGGTSDGWAKRLTANLSRSFHQMVQLTRTGQELKLKAFQCRYLRTVKPEWLHLLLSFYFFDISSSSSFFSRRACRCSSSMATQSSPLLKVLLTAPPIFTICRWPLGGLLQNVSPSEFVNGRLLVDSEDFCCSYTCNMNNPTHSA